MPKVPLGSASYARADLPKITLKNCFYEQNPSNLEDQVALIPRPRLTLFTTVGLGPILGLYRKGGVLVNAGNSGRILARSGTGFYNVNQNTGVPTMIGTVSGSASRMSAEGNDNVVVMTWGGVLYSTDGTTISMLSLPSDVFYAWGVDVLNDYFLVATDFGRFYWSAVGGTTFDALDFATAESQPDDLMTLKVLGDELWLLGRLSVEVWQPTGDLDLPFQRIGGRIFGIGITARDTAQKANVNGIDRLFWVGTDLRVYMTDPNPVEISDPTMVERLSRATVTYAGTAVPGADTRLNPYACIFAAGDHQFYVLHIPGEGSFAFDISTRLWDEITSYNRDLFRGAVSAIGPNNAVLMGDDTDGRIWKMTTDQDTDGDDPVVFEFTGLLEVPAAPVRCNSVSLDVATGNTTDPDADPMMQMDWSDDLGDTWEDSEPQSLGRKGERNLPVKWTQLGQLHRPGRLFRWRTTQPTVVRKAKYNEDLRS